MTKRYKILISVLALIFSVVAACIGFDLVSSSSFGFGMRVVYNFFFSMQAIATIWVVVGLFRKERQE